jgi:hypothetical protein
MTFEVLGPSTTPAVLATTEAVPKVSPGLPCKNVDLQTQQYWTARDTVFSQSNGYQPLALVNDEPVTRGLLAAVLPCIPAGIPPGGFPGPGSSGDSGWFFGMPRTSPQPPPAYESRRLMDTRYRAFGSVINLNPACFGEVYWVGGTVGSMYMVFAIWLPYGQWVAGDLPVIVHFRPFYGPAYDKAQENAGKAGVPSVLGIDGGHQTFLDGAWYYLLGTMAFAQQMIATQRLAVLVMPVPPKPMVEVPSIFPDAYRNDVVGVTGDAIRKAVEKATAVGAGTVVASAERYIFTANSHGGAYLMDVAGKTRSGLRELWMFDAEGMGPALARSDLVRRLYVAQGANRGTLFDQGDGVPWEKQGNDWSAVDISQIPAAGSSLHDVCGRICFSHACSLSPTMAPLQFDSQFMGHKLTGATDCWENRREMWVRRGP